MIIFKNDDAKTNAINAVRAAFDIYEINGVLGQSFSKNFGPIKVNMGMNSGSALVGPTRFRGSLETSMTYTATGPVTNIAARLADYAQEGDILVGEETRRLIEGLRPVFDMGEIHLKGLDEPLKVYSLVKLIESDEPILRPMTR